MTKTFKIVLILFVAPILLIVIGGIIRFNLIGNDVDVSNGKDGMNIIPGSNDTEVCYLWASEMNDRSELKIIFSGENDQEVRGYYSWLPYESDSKIGPFNGNIDAPQTTNSPGTIIGFLQATGEGMTNTEQIKIDFNDKEASVYFGEMVEQSNGVYLYKDMQNLAKGPTMTQTPCN